jgi:hypothetical protein
MRPLSAVKFIRYVCLFLQPDEFADPFQDHFHASIQPITDSETLEEQHVAQVLPVETKTFEHDDREEVQSRLDAEMSKFRSHTEHVEGEKTQEVIPVQAGEHYHHHVREVIVPVVNRRMHSAFVPKCAQRFH